MKSFADIPHLAGEAEEARWWETHDISALMRPAWAADLAARDKKARAAKPRAATGGARR